MSAAHLLVLDPALHFRRRARTSVSISWLPRMALKTSKSSRTSRGDTIGRPLSNLEGPLGYPKLIQSGRTLRHRFARLILATERSVFLANPCIARSVGLLPGHV